MVVKFQLDQIEDKGVRSKVKRYPYAYFNFRGLAFASHYSFGRNRELLYWKNGIKGSKDDGNE